MRSCVLIIINYFGWITLNTAHRQKYMCNVYYLFLQSSIYALITGWYAGMLKCAAIKAAVSIFHSKVKYIFRFSNHNLTPNFQRQTFFTSNIFLCHFHPFCNNYRHINFITIYYATTLGELFPSLTEYYYDMELSLGQAK